MKKLLITLAIVLAILGGTWQNVMAQDKSIELLPTMNTQSSTPNRVWVGTFQIVWNEFMDNFIYKPIKFINYKSETAKNLNRKEFKKTDISDKSYYTAFGIVSPNLKTKIEKGIKDKFNETSDILNNIDWTYNPRKILVYAMLKKDFKFLTPFDKLSDGPFAQNYTAVKYFGINENSNAKLHKNLEVMFYNSKEDFAVKLYTKDKDLVYLYRTNEDKTFDKYFSDINKKTKQFKGDKKFNSDDRLRIPDINLYTETSFSDIEGHQIKGTDYIIEKTIETVDFKMNNEGVKLKSEAALIAKCLAMPIERGRQFMFTDKFVLFLIEKGKKTPYYAMRIDDVETINKTGK